MGNNSSTKSPSLISIPGVGKKLDPDVMYNLIYDILQKKQHNLIIPNICNIKDGYIWALYPCNKQIYTITQTGIYENRTLGIQYTDQSIMIQHICSSKCENVDCVGSCSYEILWNTADLDPLFLRSIVKHLQKLGALKLTLGYGNAIPDTILYLVHAPELGIESCNPDTYNFNTHTAPFAITARFFIASHLGG